MKIAPSSQRFICVFMSPPSGAVAFIDKDIEPPHHLRRRPPDQTHRTCGSGHKASEAKKPSFSTKSARLVMRGDGASAAITPALRITLVICLSSSSRSVMINTTPLGRVPSAIWRSAPSGCFFRKPWCARSPPSRREIRSCAALTPANWCWRGTFFCPPSKITKLRIRSRKPASCPASAQRVDQKVARAGGGGRCFVLPFDKELFGRADGAISAALLAFPPAPGTVEEPCVENLFLIGDQLADAVAPRPRIVSTRSPRWRCRSDRAPDRAAAQTRLSASPLRPAPENHWRRELANRLGARCCAAGPRWFAPKTP